MSRSIYSRNTGRLSLAVVLLLFMFVCTAPAQVQMSIETVREFFNGTWQVDGKQTFEQWETCGDSFTGRGYRKTDDGEKTTETLEIRLIDGKIYYLATVPDQNDGQTVRFELTEFSDDQYTFENPLHDFPKKIIYKKEGPGILLVTVLGEGEKGFSFKMIRQ